MNNNEYFYLTNIDKDKKLMYIDSTGKTNSTDDSDILGVKAIITLKNTLTLKEGNGTKDNPYTFEDKEGLLGSYVKLGNGIYSSTTNYDYSKVLTTTVDTKVSVLSIGNIILNNNNTNYFLSTGVSKDSNLVYVMQDDYKVYTKVSTTTLKIVPTIALDKSLLTKGDGTIESPYEVE